MTHRAMNQATAPSRPWRFETRTAAAAAPAAWPEGNEELLRGLMPSGRSRFVMYFVSVTIPLEEIMATAASFAVSWADAVPQKPKMRSP